VLTRPTGLAVDRRRQVLYVVNAGTPKSPDHAVQAFSLAGKHVRQIGKKGSGPGEFFTPSHVAVAKDGTLYVSDVLNARVQAFSPDGVLLGMVGQPGVGGPGLFDKVKGVAVDAFGNLHAVDSATSFVQMFNAQFQPLMAYGGAARTAEFLLQVPSGIAIDAKNNIFVADYGANRIVQYQLFNTVASESTNPIQAPAPSRSPAAAPAVAPAKATAPTPAPAPAPAKAR
jgi:sugar lactone lactonase YvrE